MKFGLSDIEFGVLRQLVILPLKRLSVRIYVFGSRSTGRHHPFSDIDLLLVPHGLTGLSPSDLSSIKEAIEESTFPIKVDFVLMEDLAASYKERVMGEMIEV